MTRYRSCTLPSAWEYVQVTVRSGPPVVTVEPCEVTVTVGVLYVVVPATASEPTSYEPTAGVSTATGYPSRAASRVRISLTARTSKDKYADLLIPVRNVVPSSLKP